MELGPLPTKEDLHLLSNVLEGALGGFRMAMHEKLWKKRAKGDDWLKISIATLRKRFEKELVELEQAFISNDPCQIMNECADVANFMMFIHARFHKEYLDDLSQR